MFNCGKAVDMWISVNLIILLKKPSIITFLENVVHTQFSNQTIAPTKLWIFTLLLRWIAVFKYLKYCKKNIDIFKFKYNYNYMTIRRYEYKGFKKQTAIRLTDDEKLLIKDYYVSIGEFVQESIEKLRVEKNRPLKMDEENNKTSDEAH